MSRAATALALALWALASMPRSAIAAAGAAGGQPAAELPAAASDSAAAGDGGEDQGAADPGRRAEARRRRGGGRTRAGAITVFGRRRKAALQPGSAATIDARTLERHRHDDIGRTLRDVPGATVRDEEGWGLRPNIGMRGANPERSTRIALMEDGVPAAPAPYAAPAAYYFPLMLRIERVEVLKGPAAIRYGPNAIGGALNLVGAELPRTRRLDVELAGGNTAYARGLFRFGQRLGGFAFMVEGALVRSDGWKRIVDGQGADTGADAGFLRRDAALQLGYEAELGRVEHRFVLRLGYGDEDSHETYLGQTRADFALDPRTRMLATARDRMTWTHRSARLRHTLRLGELRVDTTLYAQRLHRVWDKVDGFVGGPDLNAVLRAPSEGSHPLYLAVLRGAQDSLSPSETIALGRNDRTFLATGVSSELSWSGEAFGLGHELHVGGRVHHDDALRLSTAHGVVVQSGALVDDGLGERRTVDNVAEVLALSAWAQDTLALGDMRATVGLRLEQTDTTSRDRLRDAAPVRGGGLALLPGLGLLYTPTPGLALLAGVFRGFAPVAPGQPADVRPEDAWNLDAGLRWTGRSTRAELIGFAGLYDNLVGTCSSATGCVASAVGDQFNGGRARVVGVEASAGGLLRLPAKIKVPLSLALTLSRATFLTTFASSHPAWGSVRAGDEVPYIPTLQLSARTGLRRGPLDVSIEGRYVAPMRDLPGTAAIGSGAGDAEGTDAIVQLDAAVAYRLGRFGSVFVQAQNLTDAMAVVSLRPFGARAGLPRLVVAGWRL